MGCELVTPVGLEGCGHWPLLSSLKIIATTHVLRTAQRQPTDKARIPVAQEGHGGRDGWDADDRRVAEPGVTQTEGLGRDDVMIPARAKAFLL